MERLCCARKKNRQGNVEYSFRKPGKFILIRSLVCKAKLAQLWLFGFPEKIVSSGNPKGSVLVDGVMPIMV